MEIAHAIVSVGKRRRRRAEGDDPVGRRQRQGANVEASRLARRAVPGDRRLLDNGGERRDGAARRDRPGENHRGQTPGCLNSRSHGPPQRRPIRAAGSSAHWARLGLMPGIFGLARSRPGVCFDDLKRRTKDPFQCPLNGAAVGSTISLFVIEKVREVKRGLTAK
jgi:hypothetical protein